MEVNASISENKLDVLVYTVELSGLPPLSEGVSGAEMLQKRYASLKNGFDLVREHLQTYFNERKMEVEVNYQFGNEIADIHLRTAETLEKTIIKKALDYAIGMAKNITDEAKMEVQLPPFDLDLKWEEKNA